MLKIIEHRGPDDRGICGIDYINKKICTEKLIWSNPMKVVLGFNRLSIQDLSLNGHQPMMSDDSNVVITFNGEIYNTRYLKERLREHGVELYHSSSDTEVLLKCYLQFGLENTLRMINGMYSIVLYDSVAKHLFIARDKVGIVPLYVLHNKKIISWSSELKGFLEIPEFTRDVDNIAISRAYIYTNPVDLYYRDVVNVEPGTYYDVDVVNDLIKKRRYFSFSDVLVNNKWVNFRDTLEYCEWVLKDSVERQMISDVPVGVQLSGGVDSTLVACYASQLDSRKLETYSIINSLDEEYNEKLWINRVLHNLNVHANFYNITEDFFGKYFEKTIWAYERIVACTSAIGIYGFSENASKNVTVLLSGEGADELFGGYGFVANLYAGGEKQIYSDEFLLMFDRQIKDYENGKNMIESFDLGKIIEERALFLNEIKGDWSQKVIQLWMKEELVCLLERQNKVNMANSVENRVPFLDDKVIEFALNINPSISVGDLENNKHLFEAKYILKKISEKYYGTDFAFRKKQAMNFMISKQINSPKFSKYLQHFIFPNMKQRGLINMKEFERKYNRMLNGQDVLSVWKAINIEVWFELFVDGRELITDY